MVQRLRRWVGGWCWWSPGKGGRLYLGFRGLVHLRCTGFVWRLGLDDSGDMARHVTTFGSSFCSPGSRDIACDVAWYSSGIKMTREMRGNAVFINANSNLWWLLFCGKTGILAVQALRGYKPWGSHPRLSD